jgi:hypothetical protein
MKNISKILLLLLAIEADVPASFGQTAPGIQWQNTIGGSIHDALWGIRQTPDGGYILGGESTSNISGDKTENIVGGFDFWVVKTDAMMAVSSSVVLPIPTVPATRMKTVAASSIIGS